MNRKMLVKSFVLTATALALIVVSVVSWFIVQNNGSTEPFTVDISAGFDMQISTDNLEFTDDISITGDYDISEISGNGINFYKPKKYPFLGNPMTDESNRWILDENPIRKNEDYIEADLYFKSDKNADVYLKQTSSILPFAGDESNENYKQSLYGDFSVDNIAGALRVAFIECITHTDLETNEEIETEELKYIWIPNSKYQLIETTDENSITTYTFNSNGFEEHDYTYYDGTAICRLDPDDRFISIEDISSKIWGTYIDGSYIYNSPVIFSTQAGESKHIKIRIWVEGTDREAKIAFAGGRFNTKIDFYSLAVSE